MFWEVFCVVLPAFFHLGLFTYTILPFFQDVPFFFLSFYFYRNAVSNSLLLPLGLWRCNLIMPLLIMWKTRIYLKGKDYPSNGTALQFWVPSSLFSSFVETMQLLFFLSCFFFCIDEVIFILGVSSLVCFDVFLVRAVCNTVKWRLQMCAIVYRKVLWIYKSNLYIYCKYSKNFLYECNLWTYVCIDNISTSKLP